MKILERVEDECKRIYYIVDIAKGNLVDVMCIYNDNRVLDTIYVMQCRDGGTVYTVDTDSEGNSIGDTDDLGLDEKDVINFVITNKEAFKHENLI